MKSALNQLSMLQMPPVLHTFPMMGVHSSVDMYAFFRDGTMHVLSLDVGRFLKEYLTHMLSDV